MINVTEIVQIVAKTLEELGVTYWVGGSMASSIYGIPRTTQDVDFVADISEQLTESLVAAFESEFYIDETAVRRAIRDRRSFNMLHLSTMYKVDIFILGTDSFSIEEKKRRKIEHLGPESDSSTVYFCTAEDIVLQKLRWFRKGGEQSERQWNDIINVLKIQASRLDYDYIRNWATQIGVIDLLEKALSEVNH